MEAHVPKQLKGSSSKLVNNRYSICYLDKYHFITSRETRFDWKVLRPLRVPP